MPGAHLVHGRVSRHAHPDKPGIHSRCEAIVWAHTRLAEAELLLSSDGSEKSLT